MKQKLPKFVREPAHEAADVGTNTAEPVDYPDYAEPIGKALREGRADREILICGSQTAIGEAMRWMTDESRSQTFLPGSNRELTS